MKKTLSIAVSVALGAMSLAFPLAALAQSAPTSPPPTTVATAYQYQSDGIYGCNKTGAAASSVGAFAASGSYVPVSDAAVELNTGYLVYLDCSLRPLVSALSDSATAGLVKKVAVAFNSGNNGGPQFSVNINNEDLAAEDAAVVPAIRTVTAAVSPPFQTTVQTTIARAYAANTRNPTASLACPYSTSQISGSVWTGIASIGVPTCDVIFDEEAAYDEVMAAGANAVQNNLTELQWGQGVYPITTTDANGNVNVVTPGSIVLNQEQQALQAGLTKTENATDIGQMVGALFAGIGAQAVSSAQGLAGITQASGGQPSYIDQVTAAASQGVATDALNTAITVLNGVLTTVTNYKNSLATIGNTLVQAIQTLQGDENQCWNNIIQDVCVAGSIRIQSDAETCTEVPQSAPITTNGVTTQPASVTLKIATSSAFSSAVIQSQIAPLVRSTAADIQSAQSALNAVNQLVAGVTNTTSQDAQSLALQQLDQLTASNSFPQQSDIENAQQQASSISTSMQTLVNQTLQNWQGIDSNGNQDLPWDGTVSATTVGWCDYNNPGTLQAWESLWKQ